MSRRPLIFIMIDMMLALFAFTASHVLRFGPEQFLDEILAKSLLRPIFFGLVLVTFSYIFEVYHLGTFRYRKHLVRNILTASFFSAIVLSILFYVNPDLMIGRGLLGISVVLCITLQFLVHAAGATILGTSAVEHILVIGTGPLAAHIGEIIRTEGPKYGHLLSGFVFYAEDDAGNAVADQDVLGNIRDVSQLVYRNCISTVVVAPQDKLYDMDCCRELIRHKCNGVEVVDGKTYFETIFEKMLLEKLSLEALLFFSGLRRSYINTALKRVIDIILALAGICLTLVFFPLIALLIKIDSRGPVFYSQTRVGRWSRNFRMYKFRTMRAGVENETGAVWAAENDPRVRPIGRFLRRSRIDELPQLYNVLRGDMSLVGPRPERPEFVHKLEEDIPLYSSRHLVKPGITGWAQVKFHYGASHNEAIEKLRYDLYYVANMSPMLDTITFLETFKVLLFMQGGR